MDLTRLTAHALARRSSRRQFFKFMSAGSLGAGLFLTRTDVTLGSIGGCAGCGGGPCNPCFSPHPVCSNPEFLCRTCSRGGGCPIGCTTTGEWFCCANAGEMPGCRFRCSECSCPSGCCHCFTPTPVPCQPNLACGCGHPGDPVQLETADAA